MKKALNHLRASDAILGAHIDRIGRCTLKAAREDTSFHALAKAITYQQLHGRAAATIWGRVQDLYGSSRAFSPKAVLRTPLSELRAAGLSAAKAASILDLAEHVERKVIPGWDALLRLDDEDIIERITQVRGIGPWSVQMLLIFSLGRPDVLPATDFGVQKGFGIVYRKAEHPKPKALLEFGERWRPFRSYAAWYLWRATDMPKPEKPKTVTPRKASKSGKAAT